MKHDPHWYGGGYVATPSSDAAARVCFCRGPQNGAPLCPCAMQGVKIKDGRYVKVLDLGPVSPHHTTNTPH